MQTKTAAAESDKRDEQSIRELVQRWVNASEQGDLTTILSLMSDDVLFMVPGRDPFGKEEFAKNYNRMKDTTLAISSDIQEIEVLGSWAWMHNFLSVKFTPGGGKASTQSGHVLTILRKNSTGNWVIARDANLLMPSSKEGQM